MLLTEQKASLPHLSLAVIALFAIESLVYKFITNYGKFEIDGHISSKPEGWSYRPQKFFASNVSPIITNSKTWLLYTKLACSSYLKTRLSLFNPLTAYMWAYWNVKDYFVNANSYLKSKFIKNWLLKSTEKIRYCKYD